jgi:hemerythrin-like domain-containing protein
VTDGETIRLIAWSDELRRVHARLREALHVVRASVDAGGEAPPAVRDLQLYCRGFCAALGAHHRGEGAALFPAIEAAHPELAPVLRNLEQDHSMIDFLLTALGAAVERSASAAELAHHLEGIDAIMENHFVYEERLLLDALTTLRLVAESRDVLGPL